MSLARLTCSRAHPAAGEQVAEHAWLVGLPTKQFGTATSGDLTLRTLQTVFRRWAKKPKGDNDALLACMLQSSEPHCKCA